MTALEEADRIAQACAEQFDVTVEELLEMLRVKRGFLARLREFVDGYKQILPPEDRERFDRIMVDANFV